MLQGLANATLTGHNQYAPMAGLPALRVAIAGRFCSAAGFRLLPSQGSYFQLVDYSDIRPDLDEIAFARWLTAERGVACIPLSPFYADGRNQHLARFCFAKTHETLDEAITRLSAIQ